MARSNKAQKISRTKELSKLMFGLSQCLRAFAAIDVGSDGYENDRYFKSKRLLILVMCFCGVLNLYVYNAGLISYLMIENYEIPINDLRDILAKPEYKLLVLGGTSDASFLKYSHDPSYRRIWNKTLEEGGIVSSHKEAVEKLLEDHNNVYFGISPEVELSTDTYPCQLMKSKMAYNFRDAGYAFKKNSPYIKVFSHEIQKVIESGLETEIDSSLNKNVQCDDPSEQSFRKITYNDIILGFIIFVIGSILAVFNLAVEYFLKICHSQN